MPKQPILNFRTVQFATMYYVQQNGYVQKNKPRKPTVYGYRELTDELAFPLLDEYPRETLRERAVRLDIVDEWTPVTTFHVTANRTVKYRGEKAKSMWNAWSEYVFNNQL